MLISTVLPSPGFLRVHRNQFTQRHLVRGLLGLVGLNRHQLELRSRTLEEDGEALTADEVELGDHKVQGDEGDGDLSQDHLDVDLDQAKAGRAVEGAPGLDEEGTGAATSGGIDVAHDGLTVEWHNGLLVFGEKGGFDAGQSDGCREEDGKSDEESGGRDSQEAQAHEQRH